MSTKRRYRDFGGKNRKALAAMNAARVRDVYPDATRPSKHCDMSGYAPARPLDAQLGEMRDGPVLGDGGGSYFGSLTDAAAEKGDKPREIPFNINWRVRFKVRDKGRLVHDRHWRSAGVEPPPLEVDADGYVTDQLWNVFAVYGAGMMTGFDPPIETEIILLPEGR